MLMLIYIPLVSLNDNNRAPITTANILPINASQLLFLPIVVSLPPPPVKWFNGRPVDIFTYAG